jgi:monoamine oxidase
MEIAGAYKIKDGTISLINAMVAESKAHVKLATPVLKVVQDDQGVHVETDEGIFHGRALVSALPLNVMEDIEFQPPLLQSKTLASQEKHTGSGTKLYIKIKQKVAPLMGFSPSPNPISLLFLDHVDNDGSTLIGFGPSPDVFDIYDDDMVQNSIRKFIPDAEVEEAFGYDWNNDPYAKGTWCNYRPGQFSKYFKDLRQTENNIFFAGADIAKGWRGFIDGAVETGLRAGRLVKGHLAQGDR